jgi:hypothetical protein
MQMENEKPELNKTKYFYFTENIEAWVKEKSRFQQEQTKKREDVASVRSNLGLSSVTFTENDVICLCHSCGFNISLLRTVSQNKQLFK